MPHNRKRATIREVAQATGLSPAAVSYALRGIQTSPQTQQRVRAAAAALGYEAHPIARALASGRTGMVGLLCGSLEDYWQQSLAVGIGRALVGCDRYALILDAAGDPAAVEPAWRAYLRDGSGQTVRIIDLLADEVDMTPARHQRREDLGRAFAETRDRFLAATATPPDLRVLEQPLDQPVTTVGDLIKEGLVSVAQAPPRMAVGDGDLPVLTADDVATGAPPSGRTTSGQGVVAVQPGDVVASYSSVRVISDGGGVLGPQLTLYRVDARRLDPDFLAGFLRAAGSRASTGSSRFDVRRTRLPRLPLKEQRAYGEAFRQLAVLEDALRETSELGHTLIRLGLDGLTDGHLHPQS